MGLADDAGQFIGMPFDVAILVDAIRNSHDVQTGTQVQKHSHLPSDARLAAEYSPNHLSRIAIEGRPSVRVRFFIKEVERLHRLLEL
jgi:hypothetical protein